MFLSNRLKVLKDEKIRNFIILQTLYSGMVVILTLFVNTFLMKAYGTSSKEVMFYNIIQAVTQPVAMITSFSLSRKKSCLFTQRIGFLFYVLVLTVLCIFGERVAFLYPLFGVLISFGAGYYYGIYSAQILSYTTDENRDAFSGASTLLSSIISLTLPLFAGFIISSFDEFIGYKVIFGIVALIAFGALLMTKKLAPIKQKENQPSFLCVLKKILKDKNGRKIMFANGFDNCRGATIGLYVSILIYSIIQNEVLIGINSTIGSILAIVGAGLYGIIVNKNNRLKTMISAVLVVLLPCIVMFFSLGVYTLIVFYAVYNLCNLFVSTPILNTHFMVMENLEGLEGLGPQIHTVREIFVSSGRILGIFMIMLIPQMSLGIVAILSALSMLSVINYFLVKKVSNNLNKKGENQDAKNS